MEENRQRERSRKRRLVLLSARIFCMLVIFSIVFCSPDFLSFLSLVGAVFVSSFGFFFPVLLYNSHFGSTGRLSRSRKIANYIFLVLMLIVSSMSVVQSLIGMFGKHQTSNQPH